MESADPGWSEYTDRLLGLCQAVGPESAVDVPQSVTRSPVVGLGLPVEPELAVSPEPAVSSGLTVLQELAVDSDLPVRQELAVSPEPAGSPGLLVVLSGVLRNHHRTLNYPVFLYHILYKT